MSALRIPAGTTDDRDGLFGNVHLHGCHVAHLKAHANAFAERWVRSIKSECLSKLILFGKASLRRATTEFTSHYHYERNHQGKANLLLFPTQDYPRACTQSPIRCHERLGGLLKFYSRAA